MRDLYQRIGVKTGPNATIAEIGLALDRTHCGQEVRDSAQHILLDKRRRELYDRQYRLLVQIGALRGNLGLGLLPTWTARCADFQQPTAHSTDRLGVLRRAAQQRAATGMRQDAQRPQQSGKYNRTVFRKDLGFVLVGLFLVGLFAVLGRVYDGSEGRSTELPGTPQSRPTPQTGFSPLQDVARPYSDRVPETTPLPDTTGGQAHSAAASEPNAPRPSPLPLPMTGVISTNARFGARVAPFEIVTRRGSGSMYLKLVEPRNKSVVATMFVRDGERLTLDVPLGTFRLRYAAGNTWYGVGEYFGPETVYSEADDNFAFTRDATGYSGYTVELYLQVDGNLDTDKISKGRFDEE